MKTKNTAKNDQTAPELGARIRLLRRRRGLTQTALAERIGICAPPMNSIEKGRNYPSTPVLFRIAQALQISLDELRGNMPPAYVVRESGLAQDSKTHPALAATSHAEEAAKYAPMAPQWPVEYVAGCRAKVLRLNPTEAELEPATIQKLDAVVNAFLALEDICGAPKRARIPLRLARPETETGLENMVARVRGLLGIGDAVIFDYIELLENAGLRMIFLPLPKATPSVCCHDSQSENAFFLINSGPNMNVEHQLFRLAYELGRIFLHISGASAITGRHPTPERAALDPDRAARRFAAFFLMPAEAVHTTVAQLGAQPNAWTWELLMRIKHRFGVSAETFLYRLGELELVTNDLLEALKTRIKAHYKKTNYKEPDGTRRALTPNGRLGDLLLLARASEHDAEEVAQIETLLAKHKVLMP